MKFEHIDTQNAFVTATKELDNIIASNGFCPRNHYSEIYNYLRKYGGADHEHHSDTNAYWHSTVGIVDNGNIHKNYYSNIDGNTVHISFDIAKNLSERNAVYFGGSHKPATKVFAPYIRKLRRLCKAANAELQHLESVFNDTPEGIFLALENKSRDILKELTTTYRSIPNYNQIQRSTSSIETRYVYEHRISGEIGRITYTCGGMGSDKFPPISPSISVFFENNDIHHKLQLVLEPLKPLAQRFQEEVVEVWEQEQIIKRLKGITADPLPF